MYYNFIITTEHPSLEGHFPGNPIVPGVVILDELMSIILNENVDYKIAGFSSVKFLEPLLANQEVSVKLSGNHSNSSKELKIKFSLYHDGTLITQGEVKLGKYF